MDISHQELYFRTIVVLFGLIVATGGVVLEAALILKILEAIGGLVIIVLATIKRFKLWP